jgi:hypothetical protein
VLTIAAIGRFLAVANARMASLWLACLPVSMTIKPSGASMMTVLPSGPRPGIGVARIKKVFGAISIGGSGAAIGIGACNNDAIRTSNVVSAVMPVILPRRGNQAPSPVPLPGTVVTAK